MRFIKSGVFFIVFVAMLMLWGQAESIIEFAFLAAALIFSGLIGLAFLVGG